jgi:hypothetical protein
MIICLTKVNGSHHHRKVITETIWWVGLGRRRKKKKKRKRKSEDHRPGVRQESERSVPEPHSPD